MLRNQSNAMILGVCAGLADEFGVNASIVRLIFIVLTMMGFGLPIFVYLILALLMPTE